MALQIVGGKYKGYKLKSPPGRLTRPSSAKLRAAIFNILRGSVNGAHFLDLYAGTGAVGLEALSENAQSATLVEYNGEAFKVLRENCKKFPLNTFNLFREDSTQFCSQCLKFKKKFDILFADPPFHMDYSKLLEMVPGLVETGGVIMLQFPVRNEPCWIENPSEIKNYGESGLAIFYT